MRTDLQIEHQLEQLGSLEEWQALRVERIDRLSMFLHRACAEAHRENDTHGWWSRHVVWAIHRLEQLDYRFPEVEHIPTTHPHTLADVAGLAA
jgi:hypothetical protein